MIRNYLTTNYYTNFKIVQNKGQWYTFRKGEMFRTEFVLNFSLKVLYVFYVSGFHNPIQYRGAKRAAPSPTSFYTIPTIWN